MKPCRVKKQYSMLLIPLLLFLFVSGCMTVGPDYVPPGAAVPEKWNANMEQNISPETDRLKLANWWKSFNDPVLTNLVTRGIENNPGVEEAELRVREARIRRGISNADKYPSVSGSGSATRSRSSNISTESYRMGVDASWELDLFGGVRRSIEVYDANIGSSIESLNDVIKSLISEIALNYVNLRLYQAQMDVTLKNLEIQEETHRIVKWRYDSGLVTALDFESSTYNLEQTRSQIPGLQQNIDQAQNRIAVLLGVNPGTLKAELDSVKSVPLMQDTLKAGIPADIIRQRPDLRKAEYDIAAQTAQIGVAMANRYPKITLSGSINLSAASVGDLIESDSLSTSIGPSLSLPIFRAGAIKRNIEVQSTVADQLLVNYKSLVLSALEEVENAMASCFYEKIRRDHLKKALESAERSLELSREQYNSGLVDFRTLLDAQKSLLSLQDQLTQSEGQISINYISLYKALGGGWPSDRADS